MFEQRRGRNVPLDGAHRGRADHYKGASQALTELIAGQTQYIFGVPGSVMPHVKAGRLRTLAITGARATPLMPRLPPVAQTLPRYEVSSRLAIFAPAGTPAAIVARVNREIVRVVNLPEAKVKFHETQMEVVSDPPEALAALIKSEIATTAKIIKKAGIRADQADCAIIGENPQRTLLTTGGEEKQCSRATCRKH